MQLLELVYNLGIFIGGMMILILGSDFFVESVSKLAKHLGVSELLIGLTVVAIGTSLPEIVSSTAAVFVGMPGLAFSNVMGSFIINLTLIVGVSAVITPLASNAIVLERDTKVMILLVMILTFTIVDPLTPGSIVIWESVLFIIVLIAYLSFVYTGRDEAASSYQFHLFVNYLIRFRFLTSLKGVRVRPRMLRQKPQSSIIDSDGQEASWEWRTTIKEVLIISLGCAAIVLGAQFTIYGVEFIMETWGIREGAIGLTVIALGTSLPELTVSINSARRGFGRLLIGNVVGSNIVNITLGLGLAPFFIPIQVDYTFAILMIGFAFFISFVFFYIIRRDWKVTRFEGVILLVLYAISQVVLVYVSQFGGG